MKPKKPAEISSAGFFIMIDNRCYNFRETSTSSKASMMSPS